MVPSLAPYAMRRMMKWSHKPMTLAVMPLPPAGVPGPCLRRYTHGHTATKKYGTCGSYGNQFFQHYDSSVRTVRDYPFAANDVLTMQNPSQISTNNCRADVRRPIMTSVPAIMRTAAPQF